MQRSRSMSQKLWSPGTRQGYLVDAVDRANFEASLAAGAAVGVDHGQDLGYDLTRLAGQGRCCHCVDPKGKRRTACVHVVNPGNPSAIISGRVDCYPIRAPMTTRGPGRLSGLSIIIIVKRRVMVKRKLELGGFSRACIGWPARSRSSRRREDGCHEARSADRAERAAGDQGGPGEPDQLRGRPHARGLATPWLIAHLNTPPATLWPAAWRITSAASGRWSKSSIWPRHPRVHGDLRARVIHVNGKIVPSRSRLTTASSRSPGASTSARSSTSTASTDGSRGSASVPGGDHGGEIERGDAAIAE